MAERCKARDCGRCLAGTAGSNPAGGTDVCFSASVVCCQVEVSAKGRSLVQRVLLTVLCHCVRSGNLKNQTALARVVLLRHSVG